MKFTRISPTFFCSLALIVGCAKMEDAPPQASSTPATQPSGETASANPAPAPTASMIMIDRSQQWFPPAMLRISSDNGKVVVRLYSDDPKDVLTGKDTVNSYDLMMPLPDVADPANIDRKTWVCRSSSMEKQDSPYGIFLNNQQDVLQPASVQVYFEKSGDRMRTYVQGTFSRYHLSEQMPNPAPTLVSVAAILDAKVVGN